MPVYLVTESQRVIYQEFIFADNPDLARIEAMKMRRRLRPVSYQGFGVDDVEEWDGDTTNEDILYATH